MLQKEACSGAIDDLAHVKTQDCLADCLTKIPAKPDALIQAVQSGNLPNVDVHPSFRSLMRHKAFLASWLTSHLDHAMDICTFLGHDIRDSVYQCFGKPSLDLDLDLS